MRTVNQITKEYNSNNFGFEYKMTSPKTLEVQSWWGMYDAYLSLTKTLMREGYTVIG